MSSRRVLGRFESVGAARGLAGPVLLGVAIAVAACGGGSQPAASGAPEGDAGAAVGSLPEELPERDVSGIDVCAAIPAEALAEATGLPVAEPAARMPEDPGPNCTYRLRGSSGSGERVDIYLQDALDYDWARQTAESFGREVREIADLGVAAYTKETPDGWPEVWARRADGLVVHTLAWQEPQALIAARVALERVP